MNEKSLDVLKQYNLNVYKAGRGRGGMILNTDCGTKLFLECSKCDRYYEREDTITQAVAENGFGIIDTYIRNSDGNLVSQDEEGRRYVIKDWFDGRECNVGDITDLCFSVNALGRLHNTFKSVAKEYSPGTVEVFTLAAENNSELQADKDSDAIKSGNIFKNGSSSMVRDTYLRHMRELKSASNYLRSKKNKSDFEQLAFKNIRAFYDEAKHAVSLINDERFDERFKDAQDSGELIHGSYNYHNILFSDKCVAITNFDKCKNECQIYDLYQFMRKILEKYNWDIQLGYKLIDEYDKVKPIDDTDLNLLSALFEFPFKFWKIINYYYNSSKSWIPPKSIEKLKLTIDQNDKRRKFIETIA